MGKKKSFSNLGVSGKRPIEFESLEFSYMQNKNELSFEQSLSRFDLQLEKFRIKKTNALKLKTFVQFQRLYKSVLFLLFILNYRKVQRDIIDRHSNKYGQ